MRRKVEKWNKILGSILYVMAIGMFLYGAIKLYRGEEAFIYFFEGACCLIISSGEKVWDKKKNH